MSEFDALRADDSELAVLRDRLRKFLADDAEQFGWEPAVDCWLSRWDTEFSARLAQAGFIGLTIPVEYGGQGLSHLHRYVVTEELLACGAPVGAHWIADRQVAPALLTYGNEEQRRRLLPRIASGTWFSAIGMSEHGAGSDLAAVTTRATRTDNGWVLNGSKVWTSGAHLAHQIVVLARTSPLDPNHRHAGFSQFIVPTDTPGVTIEPIIQMNGEHHFNEVLFDDVVLTDADLLGEVGNGWHQVTAELGFERSGPERFLSTATLLFDIIQALNDRTCTEVGDLLARLISLRQLSISVARELTAGRDASARAAMVKDLGTRFEQESVEIAAELLDRYEGPSQPRLQTMLDTARVHSPLFTLRGGTNEVLRGIVAKSAARSAGQQPVTGDFAELQQLADQIGLRGLDTRTLPAVFDATLWRNAESSGLTRLIDTEGAGPAASAVVLGTLAQHAAAVPLAETDVLATWLAAQAGLTVPDTGPLTVAYARVDSYRPVGSADGDRLVGSADDDRLVGSAEGVPWPRSGPVVLAVRAPDALHVAVLNSPDITAEHHNLAGEPRGTIEFDLIAAETVRLPVTVADELLVRGAWARCLQIIGAFDSAAALTVTHIGARTQFGKPLGAFQAVQHSVATMLGEMEQARAATRLAVQAADDFGFGDARTGYAVNVAKVAVGRAVSPVTTIAHQLHGAIGTTAEHPLWLATLRARSWADEFGSTGCHARRLSELTHATQPWDVTVGRIRP
ncbi:alkylation response protein AidB-like acyl-CoA dehydrogenase [Mycobacterium sp. OTB74]|nr:alkylation response protein AidB-like acyl-CoA dehydrogenase [Mycobacterium sp. OTB74]